ncbi:MAG TPA: hypothetical protein VF476_01910 [Chitinophagaceae bacterium]
MKRIIVMFALLLNVAGNTVWAAGEENVPAPALKTYSKEFPKGKYEQWERVEKTDVYLVRFVENEKGLVAYIKEDGSLLATARLVTRETLPLNIDRIIEKQYSNFQINKIEELITEGSVSYLFSMNDQKSKILLRIFSNGVQQRIKKEKIEEQ